jgi:hypothetical protein
MNQKRGGRPLAWAVPYCA